jgi:hypothetical protein
VTKILRDEYQVAGRPSREEFSRMPIEERLKLPVSDEPIPRWALDPDFRRRQFVDDVAPLVEQQQGPGAVIKARADLEREIQADEVLWERYLVSRQHRATA